MIHRSRARGKPGWNHPAAPLVGRDVETPGSRVTSDSPSNRARRRLPEPGGVIKATRRLTLGLIGLLLASCTGSQDLSRDLPQRPPGLRHGDSYIAFHPEPQYVEGGQPYAEAIVTAETNLPDGTLVIVEYEDGDGHGYSCCRKVETGDVTGRAGHTSCRNEALGNPDPPSTSFRITFTVLPDTAITTPECLDPEGCSNPQPPNVLQLLGDRFERLSGPQVLRVEGVRALVASMTFPWNACPE
jgi:hypothetical protein